MNETQRDARLEQLEASIAFQQRTIDQLNDVIIQLRADLDRMQYRYDQQQSRLQWLSDNMNAGESIPDEKPPHY